MNHAAQTNTQNRGLMHPDPVAWAKGASSVVAALAACGLRIWLARITGNEDLGNAQWKYSHEEVKLTGVGYGKWDAVANGRTGNLDAYHLLEEPNAAASAASDKSAAFGGGYYKVSIDNDDVTGSVKAVPTGSVVPMFELTTTDDNGDPAVVRWFIGINVLDMGCAS